MRRSRLFTPAAARCLSRSAIYLIPFAGIAFLWHAHTTRLLIRPARRRRRPFRMGCSWCPDPVRRAAVAGTASAGAVALLKDLTAGPLPSADFARGMLAVGYGMVFVYAIRGAGMYALTTTTLLREARNHAHLAGRGGLPAGRVPAGEHDAASGGRAGFPRLGRARWPGDLHPRRSGRRTGRTLKGNPHDYTATARGPSDHTVDGGRHSRAEGPTGRRQHVRRAGRPHDLRR